MMKIAIISTLKGGPWGGSEELWAAMAHAAIEHGHEVLISTLRWSEPHPKLISLRAHGAKLYYRPRLTTSKLGQLQGKVLSPFRALFKQRPDIILINQGGTYDPLMDNLGDLFPQLYSSGIPYVVLCHRNESSFVPSPALRAKAARWFQGAARVLFVAEDNLRTAERQLAQALPNARVVRNPVNLDDCDPVPWPSIELPQLANVARLDASFKGQDLLLEALSHKAWRDRPWHLNVYGTGPDRDYLETLAQHFGLARRVTFHGHVGDVRSIWANNHLLVLPSRREGTPLSLVEAMLCGRPAMVTDVGGNAEWITEGEDGFIAKGDSVAEIFNAMECAWAAQGKWHLLGQTAHAAATARFIPQPGKQLLNEIISSVPESLDHPVMAHASLNI
jgi:glycosyltransferase involved in cell wall biosynthesis